MGIFNNPGGSGETHTKASQTDVDNEDDNSYMTGKTFTQSKVIKDFQQRLNLRQDPVYYYSSLAHNNKRVVEFKTTPDRMTLDHFNLQSGDLIFDIPGVYQITYIDNYKSENATTFNISLDDTDLDGILHVCSKSLPRSVDWNLINYTIIVPIKTYCSLSMSLSAGLLDGTANSKLIIHKISDFPSDLIT